MQQDISELGRALNDYVAKYGVQALRRDKMRELGYGKIPSAAEKMGMTFTELRKRYLSGELSARITPDLLAKAIANRVMSGAPEALEKAKKTAYDTLQYFGYSDRALDNMLGFEERQLFYQLEEVGLLKVEREETNLHDGREWRIFYWLLCKREIHNAANEYRKPEPNRAAETDVYNQLDPEIWLRRAKCQA
jgi:hypothetical protein